ncbi:hypothetical protein STAQ_27670 [Allostella sp. ATCC 35155]|nr:hypothetical protein STAQ_27670 [Stella sp. ATCC 35155]
MDWHDAEAAIRAHVEAQWPLSQFAAMPLAWENEFSGYQNDFITLVVEGTYADKSIYGSSGKRLSVEAGIVFFHCFVEPGRGKAAALAPVVAMTRILELRAIQGAIRLEGGAPPSPVAEGPEVAAQQPGGAYYRCSGSVPFIVIGNR